MDFFAISLILVIVLLLYLFLPNSLPDIPGPPLHDYLPGGTANNLWADPHRFTTTLLDLARHHGEVFQVWLGFTSTVVLSNATDLAHATTVTDDFEYPQSLLSAFHAAVPNSLLTMARSEHLKARRHLRHGFNHSLIPSFHKSMLHAVKEISSELDSTPLGKIVDISSTLFTATLRILLDVALGASMELKERRRFGGAIDTVLKEMVLELIYYPSRGLLSMFGTRRRLHRAQSTVEALARDLIQERFEESPTEKTVRGPDLLDAIITLEDHDTARMVSEVSAFVMAGSHSVSATLSWALFYLCCNPRAYEKLEAELDTAGNGPSPDAGFSWAQMSGLTYVHKVWKETMRLSTPASGTMRVARRDVTLRGSNTVLPAGTQVHCFFPAAHTSPKYFDEPTEFIPERWGTVKQPGEADSAPVGAFMPFGAGVRGCAGRFFAEYEGPVVLAELVRQFRFKLACPAGEVRRETGFTETPQWSSKGDGVYDMGVPLFVSKR